MFAPMTYPVRAYRPRAVDCRKVKAFKAAQLLAVEKKSAPVAPDFSWFKPTRPAPAGWSTVGATELYYCYPEPAPVLMVGPGPQPVALLPATCPVKSITAPLVEASKRKEQAAMVVEYRTAEIQSASLTPIMSVTPARPFWAGASTTIGLPETIDTKQSAATLAAARASNSPFLIGSSKRH